MINVIVTGAAGYIGGQIVLRLKDLGYTVYSIDRRVLPDHLAGVADEFLCEDFSSDAALSWIISKQPRAIIHCAGTSLVGPSVSNPAEYYNNNVVKTLRLLDIVRKSMPKTKFIFSSSAATYGAAASSLSAQETDIADPINPYGQSKHMIEQVLESYHRAYDLNYVSFRFFNACGADPQKRHGQEPGATHIIARVLESIRDNREFTLYGTDYDTTDGTCIRDYVHVDDIAQAHVLSLFMGVTPGIYNLGSDNGTSNREIIAAAERITGKTCKVILDEKREGDPPVLVATCEKFTKIGWRKNWDLDAMINHAWRWYIK
jgi:UDP-glucose 4-epimerase